MAVFQSIVEEWCKTYKPMLHSKENRRFFFTDSMAGVVELAKGIVAAQSPCVVMESAVEGGGPVRRPSRNYPIYFFVKADKMADGDAAMYAKEEAWVHATNFLTWLIDRHDRELENNIDGDYARIDLDNLNLAISSTDPIENGWYGVLIQMEREEPINLCVNEDLYINDDCDCDSESEK